MAGCLPVPGYVDHRRKTGLKECQRRNEYAFGLLAERRFRFVVLAGSWPADESFGGHLGRAIATIEATGARVIVILRNESIKGGATCPIRGVIFGSSSSCSVPKSSVPAYWAKLRIGFPTVHFIDPNEIICANDNCSPVLGDVLLYRDDTHLNDVGSRLIGRILAERGHGLIASRSSDIVSISGS